MSPDQDRAGAGFWSVALDIYANPDAQAALLELQDAHGGDVMAILWALAAGRAGRAIAPADMAAFDRATSAARREAARLRRRRRELKGASGQAYAAAKTDELAAERAVAAAAPDPALAGTGATTSAGLADRNFAVAVAGLSPPLSAALLAAFGRRLNVS